MIKASDLRKFMESIPDSATVIFNKGNITFCFGENIRAFNTYGAEWDNGIGYRNSTVCCGECSHFDCSQCNEFERGK